MYKGGDGEGGRGEIFELGGGREGEGGEGGENNVIILIGPGGRRAHRRISNGIQRVGENKRAVYLRDHRNIDHRRNY